MVFLEDRAAWGRRCWRVCGLYDVQDFEEEFEVLEKLGIQ